MTLLTDPERGTSPCELVVNWDPRDPSFTQNGTMYTKICNSWTEAYNAALRAIIRIDTERRAALRRGLTPIPLQLLTAEADVRHAMMVGAGIGARFSWKFIGNATEQFDVTVIENDGVFKGIHDYRNDHP